jgi:hypothetical protein
VRHNTKHSATPPVCVRLTSTPFKSAQVLLSNVLSRCLV